MAILAAPSFMCAESAKDALVFYGDKQLTDAFWAPLFASVQQTLAKEDFGASSSSLDRSPRLLRSTELLPGEEFSHVIQVKLIGRCDVVQQAYRPLKPGPLGWVLRIQGEIQPYVYIDCARMAQTLNATTLGMSDSERTQAMVQAIAHVLVHECIHITTQSSGHTEHGITQARLTAHALVSEPETAAPNPVPSGNLTTPAAEN
jgi:hypothetical protein